jgi:hypothetical protein
VADVIAAAYAAPGQEGEDGRDEREEEGNPGDDAKETYCVVWSVKVQRRINDIKIEERRRRR